MGSVVVGGRSAIPTRICGVDFGQRVSQQGKLRHQIPLRRVRTVSPYAPAETAQLLGGAAQPNPFLMTSSNWCNSDTHHYIK